MREPRNYIIFPLDVATRPEAEHLVHRLAGHVGLFKVGLELFIRTGPALIQWIRAQGDAGIFLDLKLHDIPMTVARAMEGIADMQVDLTTVHCGENAQMLEAAVTGVPDDKWGETGCAYIQLRPGKTLPSGQELTAFLRERLAPYKVPRYFVPMEDFPRTAAGKIQKHLLPPLQRESA